MKKFLILGFFIKKHPIENHFSMKFRILLFFILIIGYCNSQEKFDITIQSVSTTKSTSLFPSLGLSLGKSKLHVGALIGKEYVNSNNILGAQGEFLFFPNEDRNKLSFFFNNSISYASSKQEFSTSIIKTDIFQIIGGYGFIYNLPGNFFLKNSLGLGALLEKRKFNFDTNDTKNKWGFAGIFSIGLGYHL